MQFFGPWLMGLEPGLQLHVSLLLLLLLLAHKDGLHIHEASHAVPRDAAARSCLASLGLPGLTPDGPNLAVGQDCVR